MALPPLFPAPPQPILAMLRKGGDFVRMVPRTMPRFFLQAPHTNITPVMRLALRLGAHALDAASHLPVMLFVCVGGLQKRKRKVKYISYPRFSLHYLLTFLIITIYFSFFLW